MYQLFLQYMRAFLLSLFFATTLGTQTTFSLSVEHYDSGNISELRNTIPVDRNYYVLMSQKLTNLEAGDILIIAMEAQVTNDTKKPASVSSKILYSEDPTGNTGTLIRGVNRYSGFTPDIHHGNNVELATYTVPASTPEIYIKYAISAFGVSDLKVDKDFGRLTITRVRGIDKVKCVLPKMHLISNPVCRGSDMKPYCKGSEKFVSSIATFLQCASKESNSDTKISVSKTAKKYLTKLPVTTNIIPRVVYSLRLTDLKKGDILLVGSGVRMEQTPPYNTMIASRLVLGETTKSTAGIELGEANGYNMTTKVQFGNVDDVNSYLVSADLPVAYLNLVMMTASTKAKPGDTVSINRTYGGMTVVKIRK